MLDSTLVLSELRTAADEPEKVSGALPAELSTVNRTVAIKAALLLTGLMVPRAILTVPLPPLDDASMPKSDPEPSMLLNCSLLVG